MAIITIKCEVLEGFTVDQGVAILNVKKDEKLNWDKIKGVELESSNKISRLTSKHTPPFSDKDKD